MLTCLRIQNPLAKFRRTERGGGKQVSSFFWEWSLMSPDHKSESDCRGTAQWLLEDKILPVGY